jgi:hypothetical protein
MSSSDQETRPSLHDPDGGCAGAAITVTFEAYVYVTVAAGRITTITVNDTGADYLPGEGGECGGCRQVLDPDDPLVLAAARHAEAITWPDTRVVP